jgi:hypothetical protein
VHSKFHPGAHQGLLDGRFHTGPHISKECPACFYVGLDLRNIVGLTAGQFNHIVDQGLSVAKNLICIDEDSLLEIFPSAGALLLKAMAKLKLKTLRAWTINESN